MSKTNEQIAMRVSLTTIIANIALSGLKLFASVFGHSTALLSDAIHSLSDVFTPVVVMIGAKLSAKESDGDQDRKSVA